MKQLERKQMNAVKAGEQKGKTKTKPKTTTTTGTLPQFLPLIL